MFLLHFLRVYDEFGGLNIIKELGDQIIGIVFSFNTIRVANRDHLSMTEGY